MSVNRHITPTMRAIAAFVKGDVPPMVWGDPGQAKSAKLVSAAEKSGYVVGVIIGSIREATDYLGLPVQQEFEIEGIMHEGVVYTPPMWAIKANTAEKAMLIFDELTTSAPSTMKAMLRVLQERFAGDLELADHVRIICIGNPPETGVDAMDLPAAIANRMGHIDWQFDADEWLDNVTTNFVNTDSTPFDEMISAGTDADRARVGGWVTGYLRTRMDQMNLPVPTDPIKAGRAWPSPRSWTNLINVLAQVPADDEEVILLVSNGVVGEDAAKDFRTWLTLADLADPEAVLNDPSVVDWANERPDRIFAMLASVVALTTFRGTAKVWEQAMEVICVCAEQGKPDVALPAARNLLAGGIRPEKSTLNTARVRAQFSDLMQQTERGFAAA